MHINSLFTPTLEKTNRQKPKTIYQGLSLGGDSDLHTSSEGRSGEIIKGMGGTSPFLFPLLSPAVIRKIGSGFRVIAEGGDEWSREHGGHLPRTGMKRTAREMAVFLVLRKIR